MRDWSTWFAWRGNIETLLADQRDAAIKVLDRAETTLQEIGD